MGHLVVLYLENHSFDNLYGEFSGADGLASGVRFAPQVDERGVPYRTLPVSHGGPLPPNLPNRPFCLELYVALDAKMPDLSHAVDDEGFQIDGGRMDRFVLGNASKAEALGYFHTAKLPLAEFARQYTLCDRFFHGAIGGSMLNHVFLIAARPAEWPDAPPSVRLRHDAKGRVTHSGYVTEDGFVVGTCQSRLGPHQRRLADSVLVPAQDLETIGDRLSAKGVSWAWYSGGWDDAVAGNESGSFQYHHQPFAFFRRYGPGTPGRRDHLKDERELLGAVKGGRLPAVAFVKPIGADNEHPGYADVLTGEKHAVELIRAVMSGPQWDSTAIVVTYDEHGGFWDHVPPPVADRWGPGTRVPTLVIAPFARRHYVDHTTYDTTSLLALIERRWGLEPLSARDARAMPLTGAFASDRTGAASAQ
jgi:phospholipase C